jgi:hypothetical protein
MSEYELKSDTINVPRNTGIEGFIHTVRAILKMSRVQSLHIDAAGNVTYERYVKADDVITFGDIGFEDLEPWHVIRNRDVEEMITFGSEPSAIIMDMFNAVALTDLVPTAFVTGAATVLEQWMSLGGRPALVGSTLFGLPVHRDRNMPDSVLVLTAAYTRDAGLVDTQRSYKIEMERPELPKTTVEVL